MHAGMSHPCMAINTGSAIYHRSWLSSPRDSVQKLALTSFSTSCALLARPVESSGWDSSEQSISPDPSLSRLSNLAD